MNPRPSLAPLTPLYRLALALRSLRLGTGLERVRRLQWPVISVGNLSTGGSGKTPLVIALARTLAERGIHVDVLSRGYGRRSTLPLPVHPDGTAEEFGDEPLEIARAAHVPVFVAAERYQAGRLAESDPLVSEGPRLHILDDGFQHRQLHRDIDLLIVSDRDLRDTLLPSGNLREPLSAILRASAIVVRADEPDVEQYLRAADHRTGRPRWSGPVVRIRRHIHVPATNGPVVAFCGIARPDQFYDALSSSQVMLAARITFPDHHPYTRDDILRVVRAAHSIGATNIVTTEKDYVRLGRRENLIPNSIALGTVSLAIEIEPEAIDWLVHSLFPENR